MKIIHFEKQASVQPLNIQIFNTFSNPISFRKKKTHLKKDKDSRGVGKNDVIIEFTLNLHSFFPHNHSCILHQFLCCPKLNFNFFSHLVLHLSLHLYEI